MTTGSAYTSPLHDLIGGSPEILGPWQLDWLRDHGLQRHHRVLDLGCGTLRFGLLALDWLHPGRYFGAEPRVELLAHACRLAVQAGSLDRVGALSTLEQLDATPPLDADYVVTQSVLNHLDATGVEQTVARVGRHLAPEGVWLGTAALASDLSSLELGAPHLRRHGEYVHVRMNLEWLAGVAARHGLVVESAPVDHPRGLGGFVVRRAGSRLGPQLETLLRQLVAIDSSSTHQHRPLAAQLVGDSFAATLLDVDRPQADPRAPLILATSPGSSDPTEPHALVYGHYDVEAPGPGWDTPPLQLTRVGARLIGLGVGDNKGTLAARLVGTGLATRLPALTWVVQGEEESGSGGLRDWFKRERPRASWWIDESGWWVDDRRQRVLLRPPHRSDPLPREGPAPESFRQALQTQETELVFETRSLNKALVPGGCAFQAALPHDGGYLSIGPNDPSTRIHHANESVAIDKLLQHALQWRSLLAWLNGVRW